jgi:hypothetical protein
LYLLGSDFMLTVVLLPATTLTLLVINFLVLRRRWQLNRASGTGPINWSEVFALHFILTIFMNFNKDSRMEKNRRVAYHWVIRRLSLENRKWSRTMKGGKRFLWRVEDCVLYGAIELPDEKRIELLVPLKDATDSKMRMFLFQNKGGF